MIKICHITSVHTTFDTRIFFKECISLNKSGYDVHLIACHDKTGKFQEINIHGVKKAGNRFKRMTWTVFQMYKKALEIDASLFHLHDPELSPIGLLLKLKGKKVIFDIHEDISGQILLKHWLPQKIRKFISRIFILLERLFFSKFTALIVASEMLQEKYIKMNNNVIVLNNYPILIHNIKKTGEPNRNNNLEKLIVNFGGIDPRRVIYNIVSAINDVPFSKRVKYVFGGGIISNDVYRDVKLMDGWKKIDYIGRVTQIEMREYLAKALVAIVMYSRNPNHYEIKSNRFFEALGAGIPVIVSNFPLWKKFVEEVDCGITADPDSPKSISESICRILDNPNEAQRMGENGKNAVQERYNWSREEKKLFSLYENIFA